MEPRFLVTFLARVRHYFSDDKVCQVSHAAHYRIKSFHGVAQAKDGGMYDIGTLFCLLDDLLIFAISTEVD